jgi:hypothetical protein
VKRSPSLTLRVSVLLTHGQHKLLSHDGSYRIKRSRSGPHYGVGSSQKESQQSWSVNSRFELRGVRLFEKEVTSKPDLNPHTVHNHVRDIYRTLDVTARGEFLAL